MTASIAEQKARLLEAALVHVPFDGWSETALKAAASDLGIEVQAAHALFPRGPVDMALAYHQAGDAKMVERLETEDLSALRYGEKVAAAVRFRLEAVPDREVVRRGMTLFALSQHAADGAKAIWGTCDLIWNTLGDTSEDGNWYSKRAMLSGVYSSTVLFWLGDDSPGHQATWDFLDRRIDDVLRFEKFKAQAGESPLLKPLMAGPSWLMRQLRKPQENWRDDLPGSRETDRQA